MEIQYNPSARDYNDEKLFRGYTILLLNLNHVYPRSYKHWLGIIDYKPYHLSIDRYLLGGRASGGEQLIPQLRYYAMTSSYYQIT